MSDEPTNRCPLLGLKHDPESWYSFPTSENYCQKPRKPRSVDHDYQTAFCLTEEHVNCPVYQADSWRGPLPSEEQPAALPSINRRLIGIAAVVIAALVLVGGVIAGGAALLRNLPEMNVQLPAPPTDAPTATATATPPPSMTPVPTASPTVTPTATAQPTALPTASPTNVPPTITPTIDPASQAEILLPFATNLRKGAGTEYDVITLIDAGTQLTLLGRDQLGNWIYVRSEADGEGWISASQLPDSIVINALPVVEVTATPEG